MVQSSVSVGDDQTSIYILCWEINGSLSLPFPSGYPLIHPVDARSLCHSSTLDGSRDRR